MKVKEIASSTAATGPAGPLFEGQVGAYYLLAMLVEAEPRGLPGTVIDRIAFQRAAEGHPLDDVIVHAHDGRGSKATLEIQVKRSISFTPSDPIFKSVVSQIAKAAANEKFWASRHELAIATSRTSKKIDGAYQDVLTWAREIGDAGTFFARIKRPGSANDDMRAFTETFRTHLAEFGLTADDQTVWAFLRRLQILIFDFTAPGSASEDLAKERAARALPSDELARAGALWSSLEGIAIKAAASGGDRNRTELVEDLTSLSFHLIGGRRSSAARAKLAEDSRYALEDISDRIGTVLLTRHERIASVYAALDEGRYVEIRGNAGVGKSGLLKHLGKQHSTEMPVIVLSPNRTTPRGWSALREMLDFEGTARDLLSDLACGGGAILFIDNLDFFPEDARLTVIDLVREASEIPGMAVVVTARTDYGVEERNWLPEEALNRLGRAKPVIVDEMNDTEIEELRSLAPFLAPLLADNHPARDVVRNLFRLAHLAARRTEDPVPRTEADMALQWWQTADGIHGPGFRERMRLLKAMAVEALKGIEPVKVDSHPANAIDSLKKSETIRELQHDHVVFRHDVLREWAIANLLKSEPEHLESLPLDRPAPAALARGVELAARLHLEHAENSANWKILLERLSRDGLHGSWRRSVLLALVRSEASEELLSRATDLLCTEHAVLLCELIRTVMAVEVLPASNVLVPAGVEPPAALANVYLPAGPSWFRLIVWLLKLGEKLPAAAIPDVVALYTTWPLWSQGADPITPPILSWLHHWLTQIENSRYSQDDPFGGQLGYDRQRTLEVELRSGFLLFCNRKPDLAKGYVQSLQQRLHDYQMAREILKFRGALAKAAPSDLAELTVKLLIPNSEADDDFQDADETKEPFRYDHFFVPASPSQGPFYDLLKDAPEQGLALIHRLVNHAISFYIKGIDPGTDAVTVILPDGARVFPWTGSYRWSRQSSAPSCVTSALMALEAWAHQRVESGDPVQDIIKDVLGPPGSAAAFLLVAVDILLSHWPRTAEAAVPFSGCPELLCLDRQRIVLDSFGTVDLFGLGALNKGPAGSVTLDTLTQRLSRRTKLDDILGPYAISNRADLREAIAALLREASHRLGTPGDQADLSNPPFMALHALNLIDPANWNQKPTGKGNTFVCEYEPPEAETRHLAPLQAENRKKTDDSNFQSQIILAIEDSTRSSAEFAASAVGWAEDQTTARELEDPGEKLIYQQAIVGAALIGMRDGDDDLVEKQGGWSRNVFSRVLQSKSDSATSYRSGLRFNLPAIAFAGLAIAMRRQPRPEDAFLILQAAANGDPAVAHGFGATAAVLAAIDERLPCAVLRCAFAACVQFRKRWDPSEENNQDRAMRHRQRMKDAVDAELEWLEGKRGEPDWPVFPAEEPRERRRITIGGTPEKPKPVRRQEEYCNHHAAAIWLNNYEAIWDVASRPWLRGLAKAYGAWTAAANGAGLEACDYSYYFPSEWNDAYFALLANCLPGLSLPEIDELALAPIRSLPEDQFFDVMAQFLRCADRVFFDRGLIDESAAVGVRSSLADHMMATWGWRRLKGSKDASIERHIAPAIAALFFNYGGDFVPAHCYLLPQGFERVGPFLPILTRLNEAAPSHFVAFVTLNLMEVTPEPVHLPFVITVAKAWLGSYPDDTGFWLDCNNGHRLCVWIEEALHQDSSQIAADQTLRSDLLDLLACLIRIGVAKAKELEDALTKLF